MLMQVSARGQFHGKKAYDRRPRSHEHYSGADITVKSMQVQPSCRFRVYLREPHEVIKKYLCHKWRSSSWVLMHA